jgi:hypothetical protein
MHATKTRKPEKKNDLKNIYFETCNQTIYIPKMRNLKKGEIFSLEDMVT